MIVLISFSSGCTKAFEKPRKQEKSKVVIVDDKNKKVIDSLKVVVDSLNAKVRQQKILIKFTAEKCHKYAVIVKKNPSQSVFIVNWIDRSFQWINEK